jgi:hypothetical protein
MWATADHDPEWKTYSRFVISTRGVMGLRPTQVDENASVQQPLSMNRRPLLVIPSVPGFPASPLLPATIYVVLLKENHMQLTEAATLDRKSGGAEGSVVRGPFLEMFFDTA